MDLLPIFLNIKKQKCVVVGGGEVAFRKASLLLRAGANLTIITVSVEEQLRQLCSQHDATVIEKAFEKSDLEGSTLVVAATDDTQVNERVSVAATSLSIPVNVVDQPHLCSFIMPSIVDRSPIVIAISSGGSSPVLTRKLKELNETMIPGRIDKLAELLGSYRGRVKAGIEDFSGRLRFWESVLDSEIPELVYSGQDDKAREALDARLAEPICERVTGEVYLVGAGPGDPDLLTLRALRLMHKADVVLYDRLVSPEILLKLRPDAEKIYVGKQSANHAVPQETINQMLVRLAGEGNRVLRLKGWGSFHIWPRRRGARVTGRGRNTISDSAWYYSGLWLCQLCRHPTDPSRLLSVCPLPYGSYQRRKGAFRVGYPGKGTTDACVLHGPRWFAGHLRAARCPWYAFEYRCSRRSTGHDSESEGAARQARYYCRVGRRA